MREEALDWLEAAEVDLEEAKHAYQRGSNHLAVFLAHQAVEKALKAYIIAHRRRRPSRTHDLIELLEEAGLKLEEEDRDNLAELTPYYTVARYPNAGLRKPWKEIGRKTAEKFVKLAEKIVSKIKQTLQNPNQQL